jgi:hypothetical protein
MAEVGGESAKVLLASTWKTALSDKPRYTGIGRRDFKIKHFID